MSIITSSNIQEVLEFSQKYDKLYNKIMKVDPNISLNTLYKVSNHHIIADNIFSTDITCNRYFNFIEAFTELDDTRILVNIEELDMYLIFTDILEYSKMMERIYSNIIRDDWSKQFYPLEKEPNCSPYQIILSNQKQKIVFLVNGNTDDINDIRKHCLDLFKCDNEITNGKKYKEITVQLHTANLNESIALITKLKDYLRARNASLMKRVDILPVEDINFNNKRYYYSFIGKTLENDKEFDFKKVLKYLPEDRMTNLTINVNGNLHIGNIINNNNNDPEKRRHDEAYNWVANNLPNVGTSSKDFYDSYKTYLNGRIVISPYKFNKIVVSFGYENKKGTNGIHKWMLA